MSTNNLTVAEAYYTLVGEKNAEGIKKFLHPDISLYSPLATVHGKEAVFLSVSNSCYAQTSRLTKFSEFNISHLIGFDNQFIFERKVI
mgnify:CR=1 FL=1